MRNELLLIVTLLVLYGSVLLWFFLFGTSGLMSFTVFATIAANIEVLILVQAFGMEMTLGNILFATTFLVTDILSEIAGKKQAQQAVWIGIAANVLFVLVSQSWLMYVPSVNDWATPSMQAIFSNTPRLMLASLAVYAIEAGLCWPLWPCTPLSRCLMCGCTTSGGSSPSAAAEIGGPFCGCETTALP